MVRARAMLLGELLRDAFSKCDVLHVPVLKRPVPTAAETDVGGGAAMQQVLGQIKAAPPSDFLSLLTLDPSNFSSLWPMLVKVAGLTYQQQTAPIRGNRI